MSDPSRVRVTGPLLPYAAGFATSLERVGYTRVSRAFQLQLLAHLSRWLEVEGLDSHRLSPAVVDRFLVARRAAGYTNYRSAKALRPLLERFAILTVLVRLGLRAGEVASLQLDDIDWRAGEFAVRGKGNRSERLPLPADVGAALVDYLRRGRPASAQDRTVFVRIKAPHRALTATGVSQVVAAAAARAGLDPFHAHRLRHTTATEMLRAGGSLVEIGQVLRHRRALTTAIYAKVDRRALGVLARRWPGGVA